MISRTKFHPPFNSRSKVRQLNPDSTTALFTHNTTDASQLHREQSVPFIDKDLLAPAFTSAIYNFLVAANEGLPTGTI
jgi:hypothetical protein